MLEQLKLKWRKRMATTRMKEQLGKWDRAEVAARLSAIAYMNEKPAITAAKKLGFAWVKIDK